LKFNDFIQIEIPLPPVAEQRRIVAKIEELFSELDKGVESLKTAREQLKVYRQAVLKHAFEGKLTAKWREENRAARWTYTTLGKQLTYLTSGSRGWADYYSDKGSIFIRAQNIKTDSLELEDIAFVQLPEKAEGMRTRVQQGDVLITITGANVTKTAFLDRDIGDAYVSQHVALCRPKDSIDTEFLYWFLVSEAFGRKQLKDAAYGAGKPGLNLENIRSTELPLPGMQEQKEIVREIQHQLSAEIIAGESIDVELGRSEALRQSILKKAFSGQLVPQDPNDEPASVLLERIRAEKAAQAKGGKRAKVPA
jgi:type I restriction enzyme S subunit